MLQFFLCSYLCQRCAQWWMFLFAKLRVGRWQQPAVPHTRCELQTQARAPIPRPATAGACRGTRNTWCSAKDHLAILGAALMHSKLSCIQTFKSHRRPSQKQYFEKYGWGQRLKKKEQASVHPLIYICSTWKGTVCYVDRNRQLLRGSVQLVSWAGSVVFVVERIPRQHGLQRDGFHTECQLVLQKFWHSVWS